MKETIKVTNLTVEIKNKKLLDNLNFTIYPGEVIGLLGHNGVGKSTLQRILANRENPTTGTIYSSGKKQILNEYNENIVYIPDEIVLLPNLTILENYNLIAKTRKCNEEFFQRYMKIVRLEGNQRIKSLSKGNQEIIQIIILLSIKANLYLMDEPFSAVDVFRRELIQKILIDVNIKRPEASIILTSHLISEIEPILTRILYLDDSQFVIDKNIEEILENSESLLSYLKEYFGEKVGFDYV